MMYSCTCEFPVVRAKFACTCGLGICCAVLYCAVLNVCM
jgi:hypothetical protein